MSDVGPTTKFICNIPEHPEVQKALEDLTTTQAKNKDEKKFITARLKALEEDNDKSWRALWDSAQQKGLIDPSYKREDWGMSLGDGRKQLFIEPQGTCPIHGKDCGGHGSKVTMGEISLEGGLGDLLKGLFGKNPED
jgi:hypothetical protein